MRARERAQVTGHYAGPVTRLAAIAIDGFLVSSLFTVGVAVLSFALRVVAGVDVEREAGWGWIVAFAGWAFLYFLVPLAIAGRTPGKGIVGLRVVTRAGTPIRQGQAFIRVLTLPLSFAVFGLGLVGVVLGRERRALHDVLAGSAVVYDWGDRAAELPTPLTRFLAHRDAV